MRLFPISFSVAALFSILVSSADADSGAAAGAAPRRLAPAWRVGPSAGHAFFAPRPGPREFVARYGGVWLERRGGATGHFRRVFGEGVALDPAVELDDAVAVAEVERFFADNADLLPAGVSPADLSVRRTIAWRGKRIVAFDQGVDGVPIEGATAYAVIVRDRLVLWGTRLYPVRPAETRAVVAGKDAVRVALAAVADRRGAPEVESAARHVLLPLVGEDALELRPAYSVPLRIEGRGRWTAFVDARTGELIDLRDERVTMDGAIQLEHHDRNPGGDLIPGPGAYLDLVANGEEVTTDADGAFAVDGAAAEVTGALSGPYVDVQNVMGDPIALDAGVADSETYLWSSDASEIQQAQLDVYGSALEVSEHARSLQDDVAWLDEALVVYPNQPNFAGDEAEPREYCNAWSDGETINFLMYGPRDPADPESPYCNNTAMVADVVYHEYGHCLHMQNVYYYGIGYYDYAVGEAFADTMSVCLTHDPNLGPHFYVDGGPIRELETDKVWPYDFVTPPPEDPYANAHTNGLILGGALWDLRKAFVEELGEIDGNRLTDEIFMDMLRITEDIPSSYEAALVADDDNGDLADSTPNLCAIYEAFAIHGLTDNGIGRIAIDHEPIAFAQEPDVPIAIDAEVYALQEECSTLGAVRLVYSADRGESWTTVEMDEPAEGAYTSALPAMPEGSEIWYRIEAEELDSGLWVQRPTNPAEPYYVVYVGPLVPILCDNFDGDDDGGWTHELIEGEETEGADDWQRGTPTGKGGDPPTAYSGWNVWGNDLGIIENWNGKYQDNRINTLRSPTWNLSAYDTVRLVFRRWLNAEDGYYDKARVYVNEQVAWVNAASEGGPDVEHDLHHVDQEWIVADVDISEFAGGQPAVQVRFEIESDGAVQFGGWNIDELCLYTADEEYTDPDAGVDGGEPDGGADAHPESAHASAGCQCGAAGAGGAGGSLLSAIFGSI